jgi:SAM-dependent methyltransferase
MGRVSGSTNGPEPSVPKTDPDRDPSLARGLLGPIDPPDNAASGARASASTTGAQSLGTSWTRLVDGLAGDVLLAHVPGLRVLDLGHGSPEIAEWVRARAASLKIVDKSELEQTSQPIVDASGLLPASEFLDADGNLKIDEDDDDPPLRLRGQADASVDLVYCLRTFPHLGFDTDSSERLGRQLLREAARVTVDGGTVFVQIANPRSLRGIVEGIRNPITVVSRRRMILGDRFGLTRWDTIPRFLRFLPPELELDDLHGLGVLIPHGATLQIPIIGSVLAQLEWRLRNMAMVRHFGAQVLVQLRRIHRDDPRLADASGRASLPSGLRRLVESTSTIPVRS